MSSNVLPFLPPNCPDCGKPLSWIKPRVWKCYNGCPPPRGKPPRPPGGRGPAAVRLPAPGPIPRATSKAA